MDTPRVDRFLTFVVKEIRIAAGRYTVFGQLAIVYMRYDEKDQLQGLRPHWLTPTDKPIEFDLPPDVLRDKQFDKISPHDVTLAVVELLSELPVSVIPEAPLRLPHLERIPPHKRRKAMKALHKKRDDKINAAVRGPTPA